MNHDIFVQKKLDGLKAVQVLIADSDEVLLSEYRGQAWKGIEVITACNGLECVARLREHAPDVLVLEPELRWGGGDGVLAVMHEDLDLCIVPVMILTASQDSMLLDNISRYPVKDIYSKPLSPAHLVGHIHTLLYLHSHRRDISTQNESLEHLIAKETGGRIHGLRVETIDGGIIVHGRSGTYHDRQLVLAAVMEFMKSSAKKSQKVELDIQVRGYM